MLTVDEALSRILATVVPAPVEDVPLAEAYARFGSVEETSATLKRVLELEPNDGLAVYNCSCAYALLNEKEASLILLRRAFESGFRTVAHWARADSAFASMRNDAEFRKILVELQ